MIVKQRFKILRFITFLQSFIPPWKFRYAKILNPLPLFGTVYPFTPRRLSLVVLIWVDRKVKEILPASPKYYIEKGTAWIGWEEKSLVYIHYCTWFLSYKVSSVNQCIFGEFRLSFLGQKLYSFQTIGYHW